ncbi:MAG TPA: hypothetical protein VGI02_14450 [Actinomycetospora sp.]
MLRVLGSRPSKTGSTPDDEVDPAVRAVMAELGIDLTHKVPTQLSDVDAADVVITMGCGDACPVGLGPEQVRPIRDDIDLRVRELLTELVAAPTM